MVQLIAMKRVLHACGPTVSRLNLQEQNFDLIAHDLRSIFI